MNNQSKPMSWAFLFALHTAAKLLLVGIECQTRLEQVKTRQCEIVVAIIGGGMGTGRLMPAA
nr:hypothetical protein [uncultured Duncaniella sp.]